VGLLGAAGVGVDDGEHVVAAPKERFLELGPARSLVKF